MGSTVLTFIFIFSLTVMDLQCKKLTEPEYTHYDKSFYTKTYTSLDFRMGLIDTKIDSLSSFNSKDSFIKFSNFTTFCPQYFNVSDKNLTKYVASKEPKLIFSKCGSQQTKIPIAPTTETSATTTPKTTNNVQNYLHPLNLLKNDNQPTKSLNNNNHNQQNGKLNTIQNSSRYKYQQGDKQQTPKLNTENQKPTNQYFHEYCVIGAGPAGLQMGYFLSKAKRDYIILEKNNISGIKLISINKRFTGNTNQEFQLRHDWNSLLSDREDLLFRHFSSDFFPHADAMVDYLNEFKRKLDLKVSFNVDVRNLRRIKKSDRNFSIFEMEDQNGRKFTCRYVILATGLWKPNKPPFKGENFVEGYEDISLDTRKYEGKNVLILGRGNR
ncbi:hypothetical protein Anas_10171 [Armadillidium nasatum]|uniref:Uncharacterized protein n=1 Tax=Armadillidium nasatum TaxID=96803 RepID=A0A5N5TB22_9CRUS|nr:hypothetical protein Anas_10171 [Armadillidium nasatum]